MYQIRRRCEPGRSRGSNDLRTPHGRRPRDTPTEVMSSHERPFPPELVHDRGDVFDEASHGVVADPHGLVGLPITAHIRGDDKESGTGESGHGFWPRRPSGGKAMDE